MQNHSNINANDDNRQIDSGPSAELIRVGGTGTQINQNTANSTVISGAGGAADLGSSSGGVTGSVGNSTASPSNERQDINNILQQGIQDAKSIQSQVSNITGASGIDSQNSQGTENNTSDTSENKITPGENIEKASSILTNINKIKEDIATLPLDPAQLVYFNTCISPLLTTIDSLSNVSNNLATSISILTVSPIVCVKHHKLKDTIHLVYDVNEKCEDIFKELERRIDILLELGTCCDMENNLSVKSKIR